MRPTCSRATASSSMIPGYVIQLSTQSHLAVGVDRPFIHFPSSPLQQGRWRSGPRIRLLKSSSRNCRLGQVRTYADFSALGTFQALSLSVVTESIISDSDRPACRERLGFPSVAIHVLQRLDIQYHCDQETSCMVPDAASHRLVFIQHQGAW